MAYICQDRVTSRGVSPTPTRSAGLMEPTRNRLPIPHASSGPISVAATTIRPSPTASIPLIWPTLAPRLRIIEDSADRAPANRLTANARKYRMTTTTNEMNRNSGARARVSSR